MIVGVDEAGSGSLAGPLVAGAAVIAVDSRMAGLRDSKLMTPTARDEMYAEIVKGATAWAFGMVTVEEIAALDLSFERGLLDERIYKRLRVSAKDRLLRAEGARSKDRRAR